jgi:hypothetical protein
MPASDQRLFPLNVPGLCEGGCPPFCSLNAPALPMQGQLSCRAPPSSRRTRMASQNFRLAPERAYLAKPGP